MNARIPVVLVLLLPALALAHPGHGTTDAQTWVHYLTEPVHALSLAVMVVAILAVWWRYALHSRRSRR